MTPPSAITIPQDKSMPAVKIIKVWPMASTPTTMTCCMISERFWPLKNRSDWVAKKVQVASRASQGPRAPQGMGRDGVADMSVLRVRD